MRDAGPDIQFRLRHSVRARHSCAADSYGWTPSIAEIFAILDEIKRRFSDIYWDFESFVG